MTNQETASKPVLFTYTHNPQAQAAHRRLMDLLAGWTQYVENCAKNQRSFGSEIPYAAELESIAELYQAAGNSSLTGFELEAFVADFFIRRVMPLVLNGPE